MPQSLRAHGRSGLQRSAALAGAALLFLGLLLPAAPAHAIFNDNEARRALVELRTRVAQNEEQTRARLDELGAANKELLDQLGLMRRSLLEMNGQLDALRQELARLRGGDEERARELSELQRRQRDLAQGIDERLRRFEPTRVVVDGRELLVDPAEKRAYDEAIALIRGGEFDQAVAALGAFQRRYPESPLLDSARFWLGNALYGKRDYREAINTFRAFVTAAPEHPRAPEALLALANSQAELKDPRSARRTLEELSKAYPDSEAAQAGKQRLATLR